MLMAYLTLISGLLISAVAIFYSVAGLTSIFSAAVWPIIIMGTSLELAKLVATVWVKQNWSIAPRFLKTYLLGAVVVLMVITSMGIFGYLSKAHSDQTLVSGDVGAKIAVYDEKIKIAKENIDANRKALKQMDEAVDQVMGRSQDEKGADKAVAIRRGQQKERARLQTEIAAEQKTISQLSEERAPIAAEVRKVEAEVGPIKYIAAFIYGDNPDANILERAVTWVIILIVIVFDPLAVMLLLASQYSFELLRKQREGDNAEEFWDQHLQEGADAFNEAFAEELEKSKADEILSQGVTNSDPDDNVPVTEFDQDRPIPAFLLKKENPIEYKILEDADDDEFIIETPEPVETKKYQILPELQEELDRPEPVVVPHQDGEYVQVDGKMYHWKAAPVSVPPPVQKLPEYSVDHTADSVIITDEDGKATEHKLDENPTYVQNEEQAESNKWMNIHTTTEEQYLDIAEEKRKKDLDGK
jgi:hypothetical protein